MGELNYFDKEVYVADFMIIRIKVKELLDYAMCFTPSYQKKGEGLILLANSKKKL